jgi:hypothetical protein
MGIEKILRSFGDTENLARVNIEHLDKQVALITVSGTFHYTSSKIVPKLLSGARAVVYVCSALPPTQPSGTEEKHDREESDRQRFFWELYTREAEKVRSSWHDIPWTIVLNKTDLGHRNPLSSDIPETLQTDVISCVATQTTGVTELWQRIIALLE